MWIIVDALLSPAEIAECWHVRRARIYDLIRDGVLPVVHVGRSVRVPKQALDAFIAGGGWRRQPLNEARP
jgi:excisionase family DNA binding protein